MVGPALRGNTATDEIALRLLDTRLPNGKTLNVVRMGLREKVHPRVRDTVRKPPSRG